MSHLLINITMKCLLLILSALTTIILAKKTPDLRIVDGKDAIRNQFPYQVSVRNSSSLQHLCGGTIIGQRWIATSTRYIIWYNAFELQIVAGILKLSDHTEDNQQTLDVVEILIHPKYSFSSLSHDITLFRLSSYLVYGANVQPAPLPPSDYRARGLATISGWGYLGADETDRPDTLQFAYANILHPNACETAIAKVNEDVVVYFDSELNICSIASSDGGPQSTCDGDIGGPIVAETYFVGIISWSPGYCVNPVVYTSIVSFKEWIINSTNGEISG